MVWETTDLSQSENKICAKLSKRVKSTICESFIITNSVLWALGGVWPKFNITALFEMAFRKLSISLLCDLWSPHSSGNKKWLKRMWVYLFLSSSRHLVSWWIKSWVLEICTSFYSSVRATLKKGKLSWLSHLLGCEEGQGIEDWMGVAYDRRIVCIFFPFQLGNPNRCWIFLIYQWCFQNDQHFCKCNLESFINAVEKDQYCYRCTTSKPEPVLVAGWNQLRSCC